MTKLESIINSIHPYTFPLTLLTPAERQAWEMLGCLPVKRTYSKEPTVDCIRADDLERVLLFSRMTPRQQINYMLLKLQEVQKNYNDVLQRTIAYTKQMHAQHGPDVFKEQTGEVVVTSTTTNEEQ